MTPSLRARTPGYVIERTAKRLKRAFQQTLVNLDADLTADQWVILNQVYNIPGMSQQELGAATAKDKPTVTRILDKLESKKLVQRKAMKDDRRKFGIYPTASGKHKVQLLLPDVEAFRLAHFDGLDDDDVRTLLRIMDKINSNITQTTDHALL
jgi:DNA-binding MarR family transcriptional regulator